MLNRHMSILKIWIIFSILGPQRPGISAKVTVGESRTAVARHCTNALCESLAFLSLAISLLTTPLPPAETVLLIRLNTPTIMSHRNKILSMYRRVLRISKTWQPGNERAYILNELRTLVRQNRHLTQSEAIEAKVAEFESRIETGVHYKIPYPRPVNVAPGATGKRPETVTPVYLHSYQRPANDVGTGGRAANVRRGKLPVHEE